MSERDDYQYLPQIKGSNKIIKTPILNYFNEKQLDPDTKYSIEKAISNCETFLVEKLETIGKGNFGCVFKINQNGNSYAVKTIGERDKQRNPDNWKNLYKEFMTWKKVTLLNSPNQRFVAENLGLHLLDISSNNGVTNNYLLLCIKMPIYTSLEKHIIKITSDAPKEHKMEEILDIMLHCICGVQQIQVGLF